MLKVRTLQRHELEPLLDLLDLWPLPDGWRGRDFFRRYLEVDPSGGDPNVVVAEQAGRLVSCAQIFPRPVRIAGRAVPLGGIGSVFTRPECRGRGVAARLLAFAAERMREQGMELSLLFAGVEAMPLYRRLGWRSWGARHLLIARHGASQREPGPRGPEGSEFEPVRDLDAVRALHEEYSGALPGSVIRDHRRWEQSLCVAGNPHEEFRVLRRGGSVVAYVRAIVLDSFLVISELGRRSSASQALAALIEEILTPRSHDPLATPQRPSTELRKRAVLPIVSDDGLLAALGGRGVTARPLDNPTVMWRCLDPDALASRLGVERGGGEEPEGLLCRVFPPGCFTYWPSDRF